MSDVSNAVLVMSLFDGTDSSVAAAVAQADRFYNDALDPVSGEFIMQVTGILDTPFDVVV
jgi:hypothetical protein